MCERVRVCACVGVSVWFLASIIHFDTIMKYCISIISSAILIITLIQSHT